jgi:hypothetical protein
MFSSPLISVYFLPCCLLQVLYPGPNYLLLGLKNWEVFDQSVAFST